MKVTGKEIFAWFAAHVLWWVASAALIYPFLISPLYRTLFTSETTPSMRTFYVTVIGFCVALIGWCVGLVIFLGIRGGAPASNVIQPPGINPILGPDRR